jgi:hypothetical protein
MWYVYAVPTNGDPGYRVAGPMTREQAIHERARLERENDATMNYVTRVCF